CSKAAPSGTDWRHLRDPGRLRFPSALPGDTGHNFERKSRLLSPSFLGLERPLCMPRRPPGGHCPHSAAALPTSAGTRHPKDERSDAAARKTELREGPVPKQSPRLKRGSSLFGG